MLRVGGLLLILGIPLLTSGCIRRTLSVTSTPSGALVWVNDREVGRTPVVVDFTHYGTYDVRVERDGMEPMMTSRSAKPPVWDLPGPDLVVEVLPLQAHSQIEWHFDLEPRDQSLPALVERARAFRIEALRAENGNSSTPNTEVMKMAPDGTPDLTSSGETEQANTDSTGRLEPSAP